MTQATGRTALIGYTGFVGSNLANLRSFTDRFNSANIAEIHGQHFDEVVVSAARAEKWRINQDPASDRVHIQELEQILGNFTTDRLVLISTVDVYARPVEVDERTPIDLDQLHPYGAHRYRLEQFVRQTFTESQVVRLPGLFGPGLKKNVIYDLLHDNNVDRIHRAGSFQYYDLTRLADDLERFRTLDAGLVNVTAAPLRTDQIARACFGMDFTNEPAGVSPGSYDVRSVLAVSGDGYHYSAEETLASLQRFVAAEASGGAA